MGFVPSFSISLLVSCLHSALLEAHFVIQLGSSHVLRSADLIRYTFDFPASSLLLTLCRSLSPALSSHLFLRGSNPSHLLSKLRFFGVNALPHMQ
jgi:hypothetical protein